MILCFTFVEKDVEDLINSFAIQFMRAFRDAP